MASNIFVDHAQPFETPEKNNYSVTEPGAQIFLGYDDAQLFETSRINNHSVTAPSAQILLGDDNVHKFNPSSPSPPNHRVTAPSAHIMLGSDSLQFQHKNRKYRSGRNYLHPENSIFVFK